MIVFIFSGNRRMNIGSTEPNNRIIKKGIRRNHKNRTVTLVMSLKQVWQKEDSTQISYE